MLTKTDHENLEDNVASPLLSDSGDDQQPANEEVSVNVSNQDDPTMLCLTFRSLFIGILLTSLTSFVGQFFSFRTYPIDINNGLIILLAYIIGQFMASVLPHRILGLTLNPGPFTVKEHALVLIMTTASSASSYAIEAITVQRIYYNFHLPKIAEILFILVLEVLALATAGILQRYLVWPAAMIWPSTLMHCTLIRTLDAEHNMNNAKSRWQWTRAKFFWLMVLCQFLWYWFPGYIFPLLSAFSLLCMIAPQNVIYSQITGAYGLGIGAFQFDWNACVAYLDSPILVPFWAHVNFFVGFVCVAWVVTPIVYYLNIWDSKKMPIISNLAFDVHGSYFDGRKVLGDNFLVNATALKAYGEARMTAGYAVSMGFVFGTLPAYIVHTILYHGKFIVEQFRSTLSDKRNDIHAKLMSYYPEVNEVWYYILLLTAFVFGLMYCYSTDFLPGYIMIVAIILNFIFMLPAGIIAAITSLSSVQGLPVYIVSGLILPGNPIGFLTLRNFASSCQSQIFGILVNMKLAHYMKIPPRTTFATLIVGIAISMTVNYLTALYLLSHVPNVCTSKNPSWRCLNVESAYTSSTLMGTVGFMELFSMTSWYSPLLFGFLAGTILPIFSWFLCRMFPNVKWLEFIHFPIFFAATNNLPPAPAAEFTTWFLIGFIFNFILYRYAHEWWEKYAYIFSSAMSCGVAICGITIFVLLENNHVHFPRWWGSGGPTRDGCPLDIANYTGHVPAALQL